MCQKYKKYFMVAILHYRNDSEAKVTAILRDGEISWQNIDAPM
jgi:hypothetical protein